MKVVISSDYHTDRRTAGVSRYDEIRAAAHQTVDVAIAERADAWAFLGDLCDPEDGEEVARGLELMLELESRLRRERIKRILIAGNHDVVESGQGRTVLSPLRALVSSADGGLHIAETPGCLRVGDVAILLLPYPPVSRPFDLADYARAMVKDELARGLRTGLVLAHATYIPGVVEGEETLEMPRGRVVELPVGVIPEGWTTVNGHFHTPQVTPGGVIVPGALARLTKGEASNEPRFIVLEV